MLEQFKPIYDKADIALSKCREGAEFLEQARSRLVKADAMKAKGLTEFPLTDRPGDPRRVSVDTEIVQAGASIAKREDELREHKKTMVGMLADMERISAAWAGLIGDAKALLSD